MKGVIFLGDRKLALQDFPDPTPGSGEVVLEIKASGMCGSDLHVYRASFEGKSAAQALGLGGDGGEVALNVSQDIIRRHLTLIGSWTFNTVGQAECAQFVADRGIPLSKLLTHRYTLGGAEQAYQEFDTQTTGKGVFLF